MPDRVFRYLRSARSRVENEAGGAMVELALSVPLLFIILLGATEFARVTYAGIEVSNAARAAAQYAATNGGASADSGGITNAAQQDAYNLGTAVTATVASGVCVCSENESTAVQCAPSSGSACPTGQHVMETLVIKTSTNYNPLINYGGFYGLSSLKGPYTLHGYAKQLVLPQ